MASVVFIINGRGACIVSIPGSVSLSGIACPRFDLCVAVRACDANSGWGSK